jgi:hypothetical protein
MSAVRHHARMADVTPSLLRRRDAAAILAVSESQMLRWERQHVIAPIRIPGLRAVRYRAADVQTLAEAITAGRLTDDTPAQPRASQR